MIGNGAIAQSLIKVAHVFPSTLFNCAGIAHPDFVNTKSMERENLHVAKVIALSEKYANVLHISTPAVLGQLNKPYNEDEPFGERATQYGRHKRHIEELLYQKLKDKIIIARLFSYVSGKLNKQIVYDSLMKMNAHDGLFFINPDQYRCFVSENDFKNMVSMAIEKKILGVVNFTNSEPVNLIETIKYIAKKIKYEGELTFHSNDNVGNYNSLVSTSSKLFVSGFVLQDVGLKAIDAAVGYYENHNF